MNMQKRTLNFLLELESVLQVTDKVSMNRLLEKHGVYKIAPKILKDNKIIQTNGERSVKCRYEWSSKIRPNLQMAIKLVSECKAYHANYQRHLYKKKKSLTKKDKSAELKNEIKTSELVKKNHIQIIEKQGKKISILWGVISLEI